MTKQAKNVMITFDKILKHVQTCPKMNTWWNKLKMSQIWANGRRLSLDKAIPWTASTSERSKMMKNYLNVFLLRLLCCVRSMLEVLFLITRGSLSFFGSSFFGSNSFLFFSISWGFKQDSIFSNHPWSSAMWWRSENIKSKGLKSVTS